MTPHRHSDGGSFMCDRSFKGIGRVHRATGILRESSFILFNSGLTELANDSSGREWIRAFQRGDIEGVDLLGKIKTGKWHTPPTLGMAKPLITALSAWREDKRDKVADDTYRVRNELITKVREVARASTTVDELPAILRKVRARMERTPASFNLLRNYARAFVRDTLGTRHEVYQAIKHDVKAIRIPGHAKKKERKRHPLSPSDVLLLASKFSTRHPGGAEGAQGHGFYVIEMALTGMHPKEFFGEWEQKIGYVHVHGTKRESRDRMVPKLYPSALWPHRMLKRPTITKHSFERAFAVARRAAKLNCTPLDLRRSFSNWLEQAGIERALRRVYRGHGPTDIGDLYETPEILEHLVEDGRRVVEWINRQLAARPQLVAEKA